MKAKGVCRLQGSAEFLLNASKVFVLQGWAMKASFKGDVLPSSTPWFGKERLGWTMVQPSHICLSCRDSSKEKLLIRSWFIFQSVLLQGVPCASQAPKEVTWSDLTIPHHWGVHCHITFFYSLPKNYAPPRAPTPTLLPKTSTWQRTLWKLRGKQQLTAGAHTNRPCMGQEVFLYWGLVMLRGMQLPGMLHIENMPHKSFLRQQPNSLLLCTYKAQQEMGTAVLPVCALPMFSSLIWRNIFVQKSASQAFPCPLGGQPFCLYFPQEWQLWSCYSLRGHMSQ